MKNTYNEKNANTATGVLSLLAKRLKIMRVAIVLLIILLVGTNVVWIHILHH